MAYTSDYAQNELNNLGDGTKKEKRQAKKEKRQAAKGGKKIKKVRTVSMPKTGKRQQGF